MVKKLRQTNVSGLTRFLQAFDEPSLSPTGSTVSVGPSTPPPEPTSNSVDLETQRAAGKRKTGLLGPGNEAYDATGLVPFYTDVAQVPAHLQKCMSLYKRIGHSGSRVVTGGQCRFRSAGTLLFEIRRGLPIGRGGMVQRNARGDSDADSRALSLRRRPRRILRRRRQRDRLCADV